LLEDLMNTRTKRFARWIAVGSLWIAGAACNEKAAEAPPAVAAKSPPPAEPMPKPVAETAWEEAKTANTLAGYLKFARSHPGDSHAAEARGKARVLWTEVVPNAPDWRLRADMTVDVSWSGTEGADSYRLEWSPKEKFPKAGLGSEEVRGRSFNHKARRGAYGAKLPMYYRVVATLDGVSSKPSEPRLAKLLPSHGGKDCQICGARSVGFCHLRQIYVCSSHDTFTDDRGTNWQCP
jgi:hypothetical protein